MAKKLFIIGNGFDLFHHLPTTYYDLREYFRRPLEYSDWLGVSPDAYYLNPIKIMDDMIMSTVFDDNNICQKRVAVVLNKSAPFNTLYTANLERKGIPVFDKSFLWRDFEEVLGRIDFSEYLQNDDYGPYLIRRAFDRLQSAFTEWINSIDTSNVSVDSNLKQLFDCTQDLFLTFNYTNTLERVYHVRSGNICHIHGKCGEKLIFGHSGLNEEDFLSKNEVSGFEHFVKELFNDLTKKDREILAKQKRFFDRIAGIEDIYVMGFSFSSCDLRYIYEICHKVPAANWHLNSYDSEEKRKKYASIIRNFGTTGNIDSYNLPTGNSNQGGRPKIEFGKFIRATIRSWLFRIDPLAERIFFGFDPKNEQKFFKKPYFKSIIYAVLIFILLLVWGVLILLAGIYGKISYALKKFDKIRH